jgi:acetate kinase
LQRPLEELKLITLHLGNGASAAAIRHGLCIDTSMGFTPLEGLVMGTRSGDLDAAIPLYLQDALGESAESMRKTLNKESGLKGLCGSNDMREVLALEEAGDERARLALEIYCYRIKNISELISSCSAVWMPSFSPSASAKMRLLSEAAPVRVLTH